MKIEEDIKLDFIDVLIRPKRSKLTSRSQVNLERTFKFVNSNQTWTGIVSRSPRPFLCQASQRGPLL